jgi:hypothetical protein
MVQLKEILEAPYITLFRSITMLCGIEYRIFHGILLGILIMLCRTTFSNNEGSLSLMELYRGHSNTKCAYARLA